jgi:hypothetical protein
MTGPNANRQRHRRYGRGPRTARRGRGPRRYGRSPFFSTDHAERRSSRTYRTRGTATADAIPMAAHMYRTVRAPPYQRPHTRHTPLSCLSLDRARDSAQPSYYWLRFNTTNEIVFSGPQCTEDST